MKRNYATPVVEKITFDYKIQTTGSQDCYHSIMNIAKDGYTCAPDSTPVDFGWTNDATIF